MGFQSFRTVSPKQKIFNVEGELFFGLACIILKAERGRNQLQYDQIKGFHVTYCIHAPFGPSLAKTMFLRTLNATIRLNRYIDIDPSLPTALFVPNIIGVER